MTAYRVTFIGGDAYPNMASAWWANPHNGQKLTFPLHDPVVLDPDKANGADAREHMLVVIRKVRNDPAFRVEPMSLKNGDDSAAQPMPPSHPYPYPEPVDDDDAPRQPPPRKAKPRGKTKPHRKR